MTCVVTPNAIICFPKYTCVDLRPFGARIWMEYHTYLGPIFFRSESMIQQIYMPGKKTWLAFDKWFAQSGIK